MKCIKLILPWLLSGGISSPPGTTQPPSLTESMQQVDEILSDGHMDRLEKIERLEAILSEATSSSALSRTLSPSSNRWCWFFSCNLSTEGLVWKNYVIGHLNFVWMGSKFNLNSVVNLVRKFSWFYMAFVLSAVLIWSSIS